MTRVNGMVSLSLLEGIIQDLRTQMNVEILRYERKESSTESSLGDLGVATDDKKKIGILAQVILNYATFEVQLPASVLKLQRRTLRDFSLLHPIKVQEALDPEAFQEEEDELSRQLYFEEKEKQRKAMNKF
jgi:hypothetical protein